MLIAISRSTKWRFQIATFVQTTVQRSKKTFIYCHKRSKSSAFGIWNQLNIFG